MINDPGAELMAARLRHAIDLLKNEVHSLAQSREHDREMMLHRLSRLEKQAEDFEHRIRSAMEGNTQFKLYLRLVGLGSGGAVGLALLALLRDL